MSETKGEGTTAWKHGTPCAHSLDTENIILLTDSYKVSHHVQYPPGTTSKTPIHASAGKRSKAGRMTVNKRDGTIVTLCGADRNEDDDIMETVFENGLLTREYSWSEIKENAKVDMDLYSTWGPGVEARALELLEQYKSSDTYARDCEKMRGADPEYVGPYDEAAKDGQ